MRGVTRRWGDSLAVGAELDCVHHLVEAQVARTPGAVAVIDGDRRLSYREVDEHANRLAHVLRGRGVVAEVPVGVGCARSAEMIVALLAILKAGGAYVPLDPAHPRERLAQIVEEAQLALVVTQAALAERFTGVATCVDVTDTAAAPPTAPAVALAADAAMYILFTSGSTGRPKGVVTAHRAIVSRLRWQQEVHPYAADEVACARTPLGFVDSVAEIFAPLAFGVPLVIIGSEAQRDMGLMLEQLAAARATRIVLVPSLLAALLDLHPDLAARVPALAYWFVGGEPVPVALVARFVQAMPGRKLINIYGATEVSGDATFFDFDRMPAGLTTSPIGVPLHGVHARIVDGALCEVADGEVGEIVVSGVCLARGYVGRPGLTAERFVPNPFPEGGLLYKMGDLGRRLSSGDIQYLGRVDHQVKIRGMRVELGEVETVLASVPGVIQAIAVAREDAPGELALVAFYTAERSFAVGELRAYMASRVPDHVVPSRFVELDAFPTNDSGKIDRRALRAQPLAPPSRGPPPASEAERQIAVAWEAVLGGGPLGREQNLFELGGTSLSAMRIVTRLRDELALPIAVRAIFEHPTIATFAAYVEELRGRSSPARARPLVATDRPLPTELPLTSYQLPFWFFYAITGDLSVVGEVFSLTREVEIERLQRAYAATVAAFDALWMELPRFRPVQRMAPRAACRFEVRDLRAEATTDRELLQREAAENLTAPFLLERPPLVRTRLVRVRGGDHLLVAIPHIAVDMTGMELFRSTLQAHYDGHALPAHAASLRDLVEWEAAASPLEIEADARYWAQLGTGTATTTLPAHLFEAWHGGRPERALSCHELPDDAEARLAAYCRAHAVSLPIAMIGAVYAALARTVGRDDPNLLLMLDKRDRPATRELFTTLAAAMRCRAPAGATTLDELVLRLRDQLLASYEHSDHLLRRATSFNNFWSAAPRPLPWLVRCAGAFLARRWPELQVDAEQVAQLVFAIVPSPRRSRGPREVFACLNIWPEVTVPEAAADWLVRRRGLELMLKPNDLLIGSDPLIERTLQITVMRSERGRLAVTLYGGGIDSRALDALNARIAEAIAQLGHGEHVLA